jgi:hypothetical protein
MSRAGFLKLVKLVVVAKGIETLTELIGEPPTVMIKGAKGQKKWVKLMELQNKFDAMSADERLKWSKSGRSPAVDSKPDDQQP